MSEGVLDRLRAICLALPETVEKITWESTPTFRVRDKIFAQFEDNHHGDGRIAMWCKAPPGAQAALVGAHPDQYFVPPYVGQHGWIGVNLGETTDWEEVTAIIADSYRMTAPKRLTAAFTAQT